MKVFEISGVWLDDKTEFSRYKVAEFNEIPSGYGDDDIFFFGITPEVGGVYDDFKVTQAELYDEVR